LLKLYEEYFLGTKAEHNLPIILTDNLIAFLSTELLAFLPEPATLFLLGLGAVMWFGYAHHRLRRKR